MVRFLHTWISLYFGITSLMGVTSTDACDGVVCNNGGQCVASPLNFWCECANGWTGRYCDLDACGETKYLRIQDHAISSNNDLVVSNTEPFNCQHQCETAPPVPPCKSFDYENDGAGHDCFLAFNTNQQNGILVFHTNYDYFEYCGCNLYFANTDYLHNLTLTHTCYMTNTSSMVQLTCPSGHVFEDLNLPQRTVECVCADTVGYPAINTNCLPICDVMDNCQNGGYCTVVNEAASCICPSLISGDTCDENVDHCNGVTCSNGGTCRTLNNNYLCMCTSEWTGRDCEEPLCNSMMYLSIPDKRLNDGIPRGNKLSGSFNYCLPPFTLTFRSARIYMDNQNDECYISYINPTFDQWSDNATLIDAANYFYYEDCSGCNASRPWYLTDTSNHSIDTCYSSTTGMNVQLTCIEGLAWTDTVERTRRVECSCQNEAWPTLDDTCQRVDHCDGVVCNNGGICKSLVHEFMCVCTNEWTGENCSIPMCSSMEYLVVPNKRLSYMGAGATNLSSRTDFPTCEPYVYTDYGSLVKGSIELNDICFLSQTGVKYDQWTAGVSLVDDPDFVYYEYCGGCKNNQPWYLTDTTNHTTTLCYSTETAMEVKLRCRYGYTWNDISSRNRTLTCSCETETWQDLDVVCEEINECDTLTCINGGLCLDLLGYAECSCPPGFTGNTCQLDQCSSMDLLRVKNRKLPTSTPPLYDLTETGNSFASCHANCITAGCKSYAFARFPPPTGTSCLISLSHDQWSGNQPVTDVDYDYYEICEGCYTARPWYLTSPQNHSTFCTESVIGFTSTLKCDEDLYWSDTWEPNKTVECSCQDEKWTQVTSVCSELETTVAITTTAAVVTTTSVITTTPSPTTTEVLSTTPELPTTTSSLETTSAAALDTTTLSPSLFTDNVTAVNASNQTTASSQDDGNITTSHLTNLQTSPGTVSQSVTTEFPSTTPTTDSPTTVTPGNCSFLPEVNLASVVKPQTVSVPVMQSQSLTYRCDNEYYFGNKEKEKVVTCVGLDLWSDYDKTCSKYFCTYPPEEDYTTSIWTSMTEGSSVMYSCHDYYSFNTDPIISQYTIRCTHLLWSTLPVPECIRRYCDPVEVLNADQNTGDRITGTVLEVTCWPGYTFPDLSTVRTIQCLSDGTWINAMPDCQAVSCPIIKSHGADLIVFELDLTFGSIAEVDCNEGYVLETGLSSHIYECGHSGEWSSEHHTCAEYRCPPPPYLQYSALVSVGSQVILKCNPGYRFYDGALTHTFDCVTGIDDIGRPPHVCLDVTCPSAPNVTNALTNSSAAIYGTAVKYTCIYGYWFPDRNFTKVITCTDHGNWTESVLDDCIETFCPDISQLPGTNLSSMGRSVDDEVRFHCTNESTRFLDGKEVKDLVCLYDGEWSELVSDCSDERCSVIPTIGNATADTVIAQFGTRVVYHCETGYQFPDGTSSAAIYCDREIQSWNLTVTDCIALTCPSVPNIDHTTVEISSYMFNGLAIYTCEQGSVLANGAVIFNATCNEVGEWILEYDDTTCEAVFCPPIEFIENGYANGTLRIYGSVLELRCNSGYELESDGVDFKIIQCTHLGTWSSAIKNCTLKQCPPVATWSGILPNREGLWYFGSTLNYTCNVNYTFADKAKFKTAYCDVLGTWIPGIEECTEIPDESFAVIPPTEAPGAQNVAIAAGSITGIIFSMIVALDIASLVSNSRQYFPRFRARSYIPMKSYKR